MDSKERNPDKVLDHEDTPLGVVEYGTRLTVDGSRSRRLDGDRVLDRPLVHLLHLFLDYRKVHLRVKPVSGPTP